MVNYFIGYYNSKVGKTSHKVTEERGIYLDEEK